MPGEVRAVIDVGTNSVKLLVADVEGSVVRPLHEASQQTRLGRGFYESHLLQRGAIDQTARAVAEFALEADAWKPARLLVVATSAARDAINKNDLIQAITGASGLPVNIISGEQEADWAYRGVTSDARLFEQPLLVMDLGGGSTEFILGHGGHRLFAESFPLGSVRLFERIPLGDPPAPADLGRYESEVEEILESEVRPRLGPHLSLFGDSVRLVATGGTGTILARIELRLRDYDRSKIEGLVIPHEQIEGEKRRLWSLPLEKRKSIIGLPANRADVILPGVVIFEGVMKAFGFSSLQISMRGIRFAALMD